MKPWWGCCLWPGLAPVCLRGAWSGLLLALAFAGLLNLLLVSTLVYTELVSTALLRGGWVGLSVFWALSVPASWWWLRKQKPEVRLAQQAPLYHKALEEYLQGHWIEAERLLRQILWQDECDVDAGLMLATLLRHIGRWDESSQWLERISRLDEGQKWSFEIARERQLLLQEREDTEDDTHDVSHQTEPPESQELSLATLGEE